PSIQCHWARCRSGFVRRFPRATTALYPPLPSPRKVAPMVNAALGGRPDHDGSLWIVRAYDRLAGGVASGVRAVCRATGIGGGTSLPGLVIQRLDPGFVERRSAQLQ